jgi:hypothetical protein
MNNDVTINSDKAPKIAAEGSNIQLRNINDARCSDSGSLNRAEFVRNVYGHVLPVGADWRLSLRPDYWVPALGKLHAGDRIEVRSQDCRLQFEIILFDVNERVSPPLMDCAFRAIFPPDLDLPKPVFRESRHLIVQRGAGFDLLDIRGKILGSYPDRATAGDIMAVLEREALAEAAELLDRQLSAAHRPPDKVQ